MIDSSANELKVSQETADQLFKRQKEIMQQTREIIKVKSKMLLLEHIKDKVIDLRQFKAMISSSDQKN